MYDITGEINPRRGNYVSRDSMDGLDEDDDEEGGVNGHTPPVKGSAKRDPDAPSRPAQRPDPKAGHCHSSLSDSDHTLTEKSLLGVGMGACHSTEAGCTP